MAQLQNTKRTPYIYIYIKKRAEAKQTDCCGAMLCLSSNQEVRELEDEARHTDWFTVNLSVNETRQPTVKFNAKFYQSKQVICLNILVKSRTVHSTRQIIRVSFTGGLPVAERSKVRVCGRPLAGTAGSNPTEGMNVCLLRVAFVVR